MKLHMCQQIRVLTIPFAMDNDTDLELYFLSSCNSLIVSDVISEDYEEILSDITIQLKDNASLYTILNNSRFLRYTVLKLLKDNRSHGSALRFLVNSFSDLKLPDEFFTKKFIFFMTEKLYEHLYDDCITNIQFVSCMIDKYDHLIRLLYECGYFCLVNSVIDYETCRLYNIVFRNKMSVLRQLCTKYVPNADCFYEVQRKHFENEIVFHENNLFKYKRFRECEPGQEIHDKIYECLESTCLYNLLECDVRQMGSVLNYKINTFSFLLDNDDIMHECYEKNINFIRFVRLYYKDTEKLKSMGYFKNIGKFIEEKDLKLRYEIFLSFCMLYTKPDNMLVSIFSEKKIRLIFEIFEYDITECIKCGHCQGTCTLNKMLDFLQNLYDTVEKKYFYKISFVILMNELAKKVEHQFLFQYFNDIISYFRSNRNNVSRVLFPYQNTKRKNSEKNKNENHEELESEEVKYW